MAYVHTLVKLAVRRGELKRPLICEGCNLIRATWAHHDDYAKPLEVRWFCKPCHAEWHRNNGPGLNVEIADLRPAKNHPNPNPARRKERGDARFEEMVSLISGGWTLQQVGDKYGLSRERIRQIVGRPREYRPDLAEMAKARLPEINEYRMQGKSIKEISMLTGFTVHYLNKLEIAKRPESPINHGTRHAYSRRKCRCRECTTAMVESVKAFQKKRRELGLCVNCGKDSLGKQLCDPCYIKWRDKYAPLKGKPLGRRPSKFNPEEGRAA